METKQLLAPAGRKEFALHSNNAIHMENSIDSNRLIAIYGTLDNTSLERIPQAACEVPLHKTYTPLVKHTNN